MLYDVRWTSASGKLETAPRGQLIDLPVPIAARAVDAGVATRDPQDPRLRQIQQLEGTGWRAIDVKGPNVVDLDRETIERPKPPAPKLLKPRHV